jgi:hypothetical protein
MIEFVLSRLSMSLCALVVIVTIAPVICSLPWSTEAPNSHDSLEHLVSRFQEVENAPGEVSLRAMLDDYPLREGEHFILRQGSLCLVGPDLQEARSIPEGFEIYVGRYGAEVRVEQVQLDHSSMMTLSKENTEQGTSLKAYIENLEATSETLSLNLSTSSMLL